jgi:hypothetical protein
MLVARAFRARRDPAVADEANLLRGEQIGGVEGSDDFAPDEQFSQIVAITELFVAKKANPKIRGRSPGRVRFNQRRKN